jgi:hypothetical protein
LPAAPRSFPPTTRRPYDRPNCSKDYLAGNAPEDWMPPAVGIYAQHAIDTSSALT